MTEFIASQEAIALLGLILKIVAATPNKNPDNSTYEKVVVQAVRDIRSLREAVRDREATKVEIEHAVRSLAAILDFKAVDRSEREDRLTEIAERFDLVDVVRNCLNHGSNT